MRSTSDEMATDEQILDSLERGIFLSPQEPLTILSNYKKKSKKRTYDDFVSYLNARFRAISGLLRQRTELHGATAIARLKGRAARESVAIIAMINEKTITKNGNIILSLEDQSGMINAIITQKNQDLFAQAKDLVLDEIIGVAGQMGENVIFPNAIYNPDIPLTHELKKSPTEEYLAIIGDPQVGGVEFLKDDFSRLIKWFNGELGNDEQRQIAQKTKYAIVIGDLVEGVGVYPNQEKDLEIKDIKAQYDEFTRLIKQIPKDVQIICIPGNHDAGRLAEPQLPVYKDFAQDLYNMENVHMLSSPSWINIGAKDAFPGFDILLYHGYSLIYYSDNVPSIRERGGQKRADLIMKFLLQRRHLAPTHGSNLYIPDPDEDPLVIDRIPDFFITGHIHRMASATYRGVTMINASAWCDVTDDQIKRGLEPQPSRLPLINLQTRDVKVINFYTGKLAEGR